MAQLQTDLAAIGLPLLVRVGSVPQVQGDLQREIAFTHLFSHEETGPGWSYTRDRAVADWCRQLNAEWMQWPQTGVVRAGAFGGLADKGFSKAPLAEMQKIIEAENSDLFDVLAYVAFASAPETRTRRADKATTQAHREFTDRQQAFVDFVLAQYVTQGVDEPDTEKLSPLLKLRYHNAIADAVKDLGSPEQIRQMFVGFQRYLYQL